MEQTGPGYAERKGWVDAAALACGVASVVSIAKDGPAVAADYAAKVKDLFSAKDEASGQVDTAPDDGGFLDE